MLIIFRIINIILKDPHLKSVVVCFYKINILLLTWAYYKQNCIKFHWFVRKIYLSFYYKNWVTVTIAKSTGEPLISNSSIWCVKKGFEYLKKA